MKLQYLATRTFPFKIKLAKVTPLLKPGSNHSPQNYRPISNLTVVVVFKDI